MASTPLTVLDLAEALGTDQRTTRKFLRKITPKEDQPGKGSRWSIERKQLAGLKKQFAAFNTPKVDTTEEPSEDAVEELED